MSEAVHARRTEVRLWYNDRDISADVAPMLVSFEYTDFASGLVNDIQVSIKDPDGRWLGSWWPDTGARLRAKIVQTEGPIERVLNCGEFVIDSPSYTHPGVIALKATSASVKTSLRREKKTRRWENITLKGLAEHIAREHGVGIGFKGADTPPIAKAEQKDQSDLEFLLQQCEREGFALKVGLDLDSLNSLIIYPRAQYDGAKPVVTIDRTDGTVIGYTFSQDGLESYRACKVVYRHPDKKMLSSIYTPRDAPEDGQVLCVRRHLGSQSEAIRVAKATYELANRNRRACDMTRIGSVHIHAGVTVKLTGWGVMDGKYAVDEVRHTVGAGYQNGLKLAKIVES
jgi:phage protein D